MPIKRIIKYGMDRLNVYNFFRPLCGTISKRMAYICDFYRQLIVIATAVNYVDTANAFWGFSRIISV